MAKQGIITDFPICPMSIYHIHTLLTGGCGPRPVKFSDKIFQACYNVNTDTEQVNTDADSSSHNMQFYCQKFVTVWRWGVLGNSIS